MKKTTTKPIKEKVIKTPVILKSYSMTATISIGNYANMIPNITVEADTIEQAQAYVLPVIEDLIKKYTGYLEKKPEPSVKLPPAPAVKKPAEVTPPNVFVPTAPSTKEPKAVTLAMEAALNAVSQCYNLEDLKALEGKIEASTKITKDEKAELTLAITSKETEIKYNTK